MCIGSAPKAETPAAAPAPAPEPAKAPLINADALNGSSRMKAIRSGRNALRIDLANTGVQVPTA